VGQALTAGIGTERWLHAFHDELRDS